jgi:transposase-like protein
MGRSQYTAEFKSEAVKQVMDKGHSVVDVAKRRSPYRPSLVGFQSH